MGEGEAFPRSYGIADRLATKALMFSMTRNPPPGGLRPVALTALVAGLLGSLACMVLLGRRNQSALLMLMFAFWVSAPFVGLALLERRPAEGPRTGIYRLILAIAVGSLAVYGYVAFGPPMRKPAAPFLLVPVLSWIIIGGYALARTRRGGSIR